MLQAQETMKNLDYVLKTMQNSKIILVLAQCSHVVDL